jgi:phosphohistidine phosphatase
VSLRLYFLRHGKAVARLAWTADDASRPLTDDGAATMRAEADAIAAMHLKLDLIVTSPLVRALRTAELVAAACGLDDRLEVDERLAHGFDAAALRTIASEHPSASSIMVVGHEPEFSVTVSELIGGGDVVFKKGGLARVDVDDRDLRGGRLAWLLTPAQLKGA